MCRNSAPTSGAGWATSASVRHPQCSSTWTSGSGAGPGLRPGSSGNRDGLAWRSCGRGAWVQCWRRKRRECARPLAAQQQSRPGPRPAQCLLCSARPSPPRCRSIAQPAEPPCTDPYARWWDRDSGRPLTYVDSLSVAGAKLPDDGRESALQHVNVRGVNDQLHTGPNPPLGFV